MHGNTACRVPLRKWNDRALAQSKAYFPTNLISIRVDALMQHRFERRYDGGAVSNRFADTLVLRDLI